MTAKERDPCGALSHDGAEVYVADMTADGAADDAADEGYTPSSSKGETRILPDAAGTPLRSWRSGGLSLRPLHDAALRPIGLLVDEGAGERLVSLSIFGDAVSDLSSTNLMLGDDLCDSGTDGQTTAMNDRGAIVYLPHLKTGVSTNLVRDFRDQLRKAELDNAGNVSWYATDAAGERVWKVWDKGSVVEERIYLGGYEVWRKRNGPGVLQEERQTLHVMDDQRRVAMIETLTVTGGSAVSTPTPRFRYQLDDQLGSALLEVDDDGGVISYEEYHPYGTTAWWAEDAAIEVSRKRYRYTGKERDEETGLQYHSARYYAPWLGRWDRPDPIGLGDGGNRWGYVKLSPIWYTDESGTVVVNWDASPEGQAELMAATLAKLPQHVQVRVNSPDYQYPTVHNYNTLQELETARSLAYAKDSVRLAAIRRETLTAEAANMAVDERVAFITAHQNEFNIDTMPKITISFGTSSPQGVPTEPPPIAQQIKDRNLTSDPAFTDVYVKTYLGAFSMPPLTEELAGFYYPNPSSIHVLDIQQNPYVFVHEYVHSLRHQAWEDAVVRMPNGVGDGLNEAVTSYYTEQATEEMNFVDTRGDLLLKGDGYYKDVRTTLTNHIAKGDFTAEDVAAAYFNGDQAAIRKITNVWEGS